MAEYGVSVGTVALSTDLAKLARWLEDYGFESVFVPEHTHVPLEHARKHPEDAEWAASAAHLLDPFIVLTVFAAETTRLKLATGVCVINQRDPILLAKEVASFDHVSGGRAIFGIGAGWVPDQLANHGVVFRSRWAVAREKLQAMKRIWSSDEAAFDGEHVRFSSLWQWPKPVQKPHPQILVGGHTRASIELALEPNHGWFPHAGHLLENAYPLFLSLGGTEMTIYNAPTAPDDLERLINRGATRLVFSLSDAPGVEEQLAGFAQARL